LNLSGRYDVVCYHCRGCGGGIVESVLLSLLRIGLTGFCSACNRRETAWFDLQEVDRYLRGDRKLIPTAYSSPSGPYIDLDSVGDETPSGSQVVGSGEKIQLRSDS
jgi:hypothetical protein